MPEQLLTATEHPAAGMLATGDAVGLLQIPYLHLTTLSLPHQRYHPSASPATAGKHAPCRSYLLRTRLSRLSPETWLCHGPVQPLAAFPGVWAASPSPEPAQGHRTLLQTLPGSWGGHSACTGTEITIRTRHLLRKVHEEQVSYCKIRHSCLPFSFKSFLKSQIFISIHRSAIVSYGCYCFFWGSNTSYCRKYPLK